VANFCATINDTLSYSPCHCTMQHYSTNRQDCIFGNKRFNVKVIIHFSETSIFGMNNTPLTCRLFQEAARLNTSVATVPISTVHRYLWRVTVVALLVAATSDRLRVRDPIATNGSLKADSHIACCAHALPVPCRAAKGLECVFPI